MDQTRLRYSHEGDAGYDLIVDLKKSSDNTTGLITFLKEYIQPNINFYEKYLPKLYIDGEYHGELKDQRAVSRFLAHDVCVLLPPARVGHPELMSELVAFKNTELVPTRFNFMKPGKWELLMDLLGASEIDDFRKYLSYAGFIHPRSGLGAKHQISISNNVGVADSTYTGNVMAGLENRGRDFHLFTNGARVAQLVLPVILNNGYAIPPLKQNEERGGKGFGSTGV